MPPHRHADLLLSRASCLVAGLTDQLDGDVLLAEKSPVFLTETVHAFAGSLHFLRTADALSKIVHSFLELCGKIRRDACGDVILAHKDCSSSSFNGVSNTGILPVAA